MIFQPPFPSSADLAAFRRSIPPVLPVPLSMDAWRPTSDRDGAWPHELDRGIGHVHLRPGLPADPYPGWTCAHTEWRIQASALRSRTFARIAHEAMGDAGLMLDLDAAMQTFEPMPAIDTQED